jgi:hypothetical protein
MVNLVCETKTTIKDRAAMNITFETLFAKLPIEQIKTTIHEHLLPLTSLLPDTRLRRVAETLILGILGGQTPVITAIARQNSKEAGETWAVAKSIYRWLSNPRFTSQELFAGLYAIGQQVVETEQKEYLVVAVDPVNFEKPYAEAIEGVSVVYKATPPALDGKARLTHGYPAITALVVNTLIPVISYGNWFSYKTADFISQNKEIEQAIAQTCRLYPGYRLRFVTDSGLDDQKVFAQVDSWGQEFVIRVQHLERIVEVWNDRLQRWETEQLGDLTACVPYQATSQVLFTHAGQNRLDIVHFGWFKIRLPQTTRALWILVADDETLHRQLVLITNVPLHGVAIVQEVYNDWRLRTRIEHGYRFDQEQGLDVEDLRVQTVERMRRLFAMVLLAAQIVFVISAHWPPQAVLWLRQLGGKLGIPTDRDGPYWLLQGLAAVITTCMSLSFVFLHPFPFHEMTCG